MMPKTCQAMGMENKDFDVFKRGKAMAIDMPINGNGDAEDVPINGSGDQGLG